MTADTMSYWLARAAKQLRVAAERKQVHIAAAADRDQSTVYRFEQGASFPRDTDRLIAAYAKELDITALEIWQMALHMWQAGGTESDTDVERNEALAAQSSTRSRPAIARKDNAGRVRKRMLSTQTPQTTKGLKQ